MIVLLAGLLVFLGVHSVAIVAPQWRAAQIARQGARRWKAAYSIVAGIGLMLLVVGYGLARREPVVLYVPSSSMRHLALAVMLPVFPLLFAAYLPGRIRTATRHPMLLAVKFWALAHLLANGMLADVLLFGGFLLWAVVDRVAVKRRPAALASPPPAAPSRPLNDAIAVLGGLAVYALILLGLHRWLTGVSPLG